MFLDKIVDYKKRVLEIEKSLMPVEIMKLKKREDKFFNKLSSEEFSLICEIKKASPSKGIIRENFDPIFLADKYENAGADAVSILTEDKYFLGDIKYLKDTEFLQIPRLRKDFIIDEYQIYQSIHYGADAVLLIVRILTEEKLRKYISILESYGISPLVEVHDLREVEIALGCGAKIIGVNNRNLENFEVSLETSKNLIKHIPDDILSISESGIKTSCDIDFLKKIGFNGALIGEALMRSDSIDSKIKEFRGYGKGKNMRDKVF